MKTLKYLTLAFLGLSLFTNCSDDDTPELVNEEEVITTMTLTLIPQGGGNIVTFQTRDVDGDGPGEPVISVSPLSANTIYNGSISILNETESPAEDITEEVEEEDDEHQFFFMASNNIASVIYNDADGDGNPIGLNFILETSNTGTGTLTVTLRHEPNKSAAGVSDGNIANAGGETDIVAVFPVTVE